MKLSSLIFGIFFLRKNNKDSLNVINVRFLTDIMLKFVSQLFPVLLGMKRSPYRSFTGLAMGLRANGDPGELRLNPIPFLYIEG